MYVYLRMYLYLTTSHMQHASSNIPSLMYHLIYHASPASNATKINKKKIRKTMKINYSRIRNSQCYLRTIWLFPQRLVKQRWRIPEGTKLTLNAPGNRACLILRQPRLFRQDC